MFTFYLAYSPLSKHAPAYLHLMLRQLVGAAARAVLSDREGKGGRTRLMVSAHPALLATVAQIAQDFAAFVEPEGEVRPIAPVVAVLDGPDGGPWGVDQLEAEVHFEPWLHPARIEGPVLREEGLIMHRPGACIVAGDPSAFERRWFDPRAPETKLPFEKLVVFPMFSSGELYLAARQGVPVVDAESLLRARLERAETHGPSFWEAMLAEGEEIELEPFMAFGPAVEHAIWGGGEGGRLARG